jgi:uncharacterized protein (TIGR03435 family)
MRFLKFTGTIAIGCLFVQAAGSQERPQFEAASIKPNRDNQGGSIVRTPGGLTATNAEFSRLLEMAFQTRLIDLSHVPDSLRSERFDIAAKAAGRISGDQYWQMLQALLEGRFQLKYHRETRQAQIYVLALANKAKGLGPKISPSADANCPVNPNGSNFCGVNARPGLMIGQRVSMSRIAGELSAFAGRPVDDQTGLTAAFDFQLTWTPDEFRSEDGRPKMLNGVPMDPAGPSFFPAVRGQLGLQLQPQKGQVDMLVIDAARQPSAN